MKRAFRVGVGLGSILVLSGLCLLGLAWRDWDRVGSVSAQQQSDLINQVESLDPTMSGELPLSGSHSTVAVGTPLAVIRIPRLGANWQRPVVEGTDLPQLRLGVGHYTGTALPGQVGNFGIAGHSSGRGAPFGDLAKVKSGDLMVVRTSSATYTYRMVSSKVVKPTDVAVLNPTPTPTLTVTTCYPVYAINPDRLVVSAVLVPDSSQP